MELTLDTLIFKLKDLKPILLISDLDNNAFNGIKHFRDDFPQFTRDYVYAARLSRLFGSNLPINYNLTYFCINDTDKEPDNIRQHNLNIVLFDKKNDLEYVFDRVLDIYDEMEKWDKSMHIQSLKGRPPQYLVDLSEKIIEHPMIIFDPSFNVLAFTKHIHTNYEFFNQTIKNRYSPPDVIKALEKTTLFQRLHTSSEPIIHSSAGSVKMTNIYIKIAVNNVIVAYASIFNENETPEQGYIDIVKCFFENLTLYFQQTISMPKSSNYMYETFLQEMLASNEISISKIEDQLRYIEGLALYANFRLIKLAIRDSVGLPLTFVAREINKNINKARPFIYNDDLYILREYDDCNVNKSFSEQELGCINSILSPHEFSMGVSEVFRQIFHIKTARIQCEAALKFGCVTNGGKVFEYSRCVSMHLNDLANKDYAISSSLSYYYVRLREIDNANQTDLCSLLEVYLRHESNTSHTAQELFLHRNTVIYRIAKIQELLQCDLKDSVTRMEFLQSFQIQEYLDSN